MAPPPPVKERLHEVHRAYTSNEAGTDISLVGVLRWTYADGSVAETKFASRVAFDTTGEDGARVSLWQGYGVRIPFTL